MFDQEKTGKCRVLQPESGGKCHGADENEQNVCHGPFSILFVLFTTTYRLFVTYISFMLL